MATAGCPCDIGVIFALFIFFLILFLMSLTGKRLEVLYRSVSLVESQDNPYAFRFEPKFANRITSDDIAYIRASSHYYAYSDSIRYFLSCSVGRIQVLIYNLFFYERVYRFLFDNGYKPSIPFYLPRDVEIKVFKLLLEAMGIDFFPFSDDGLLVKFAKRWNGSSAYAKRLRLAYALEGANDGFSKKS